MLGLLLLLSGQQLSAGRLLCPVQHANARPLLCTSLVAMVQLVHQLGSNGSACAPAW